MERGFSRGGLTVTKLRHALSDESTRASTVLHAWSEIPGLIPEADIIQLFKDKSRRLKGKGKESDTGKDVYHIYSDDSSEEYIVYLNIYVYSYLQVPAGTWGDPCLTGYLQTYRYLTCGHRSPVGVYPYESRLHFLV